MYNFQATRRISSVLVWVCDYNSLVNSVFIISCCLHIIFSCLLYIGASPRHTRLRIPWLVTHMIIIIITTIIFICWTFITFFIDLLVTIVFPVISGAITVLIKNYLTFHMIGLTLKLTDHQVPLALFNMEPIAILTNMLP